MIKNLICIIALIAVLCLLAGCSEESSADSTTSTSTSTTSSSTQTTTTTPSVPTQEPGRENLTVEYDHQGLHFKLDSSFTVGLQDDNKNIFTFSNDLMSGTVTFGKLSELNNGAKNSEEYATLLKTQYGDSAWVGTSTGFGYYVVNTADGKTTVECLYIYDQYAWLVKAEGSNKDAAQAMIQIIGRCGHNADEIPVE